MNGVIRSIQSEKGFGFITTDKGTEFFFHRSALKNCQFDDLREGQSVSFTEGAGPKGPRAEEVYIDA